ncbi:OmpA family protein [Dyadobacter sandarakinus]|uniref:OmpA family protein n=2 Tax=Dyadobacter sandarakinus TaxID=2747268 RepID=A0ABX7IFG5_9BACT|nr:OmpA family protein [Dyadobacter sandarakinus]
MIRLMRQQSILSVNILNAKAGMQHRLMEKNNTVKPLQRIDDGHYYAEVTPGATYRMNVSDSNNASDLSMSIDPVDEGLTLRSLRLPAAASAGKATGPASPEKKTLYFPRSDYKLPVQSARYLDSVAVFVKSNSGKGLRITGHTDNVGNPDLNMTLSEYRVRVVTRYLVTKGVPEHLISAAGLGSRYPAVPNDSEENKRKNRRVEVQVIDLQQTSN